MGELQFERDRTQIIFPKYDIFIIIKQMIRYKRLLAYILYRYNYNCGALSQVSGLMTIKGAKIRSHKTDF